MIFRKIVSNLAYSPAMIWHLAALDGQIREQKKKNRLIILFCILNIMIFGYSFAMTKLTKNVSFIPTGFNISATSTSLSQRYLINSPRSTNNFSKEKLFNQIEQSEFLKKIYDKYGINRNSISNVVLQSNLSLNGEYYEISRNSFNPSAQYTIVDDSTTLAVTKSQSEYFGPIIRCVKDNVVFYILNNANLIIPVDMVTIDVAKPTLSVSHNFNNIASQNKNNSLNTDEIVYYDIKVTNPSNQSASEVVEIDFNDLSEYGHLLNTETTYGNTYFWHISDLKPNQAISKRFTIQANSVFSTKPHNANLTTSHDCVASVRANNSISSVNVNCPLVKKIELSLRNFIKPTGPFSLELLVFVFGLIAILKALHNVRLSIISKQIRLIRNNLNQGDL